MKYKAKGTTMQMQLALVPWKIIQAKLTQISQTWHFSHQATAGAFKYSLPSVFTLNFWMIFFHSETAQLSRPNVTKTSWAVSGGPWMKPQAVEHLQSMVKTQEVTGTLNQGWHISLLLKESQKCPCCWCQQPPQQEFTLCYCREIGYGLPSIWASLFLLALILKTVYHKIQDTSL